jgi:hypothetical protein
LVFDRRSNTANGIVRMASVQLKSLTIGPFAALDVTVLMTAMIGLSVSIIAYLLSWFPDEWRIATRWMSIMPIVVAEYAIVAGLFWRALRQVGRMLAWTPAMGKTLGDARTATEEEARKAACGQSGRSSIDAQRFRN